MTILVTGAAGFIGFHVTRALLKAGHSVVGIDSLNDYYDRSLKYARLDQLREHARFTFTKLDLADQEATRFLFARFKPSHVIHLAAQAGVRYSLQFPHTYTEANITGFLNVLEGCRTHPVKHLIYASSSSVYGANFKTPFSESDPVNEPQSLYAATKRANELMAHTYSHLFQIPTSGLRFFTVYGPWGRPDMAYFSFTKAIIEGKPIEVFNHGQMWRDFTYIDDVVQAIVRLLDLPPAPEPVRHTLYNVGNHTPVALGRFIEVIEQTLERKAIVRNKPMQPGDVTITYADVSKLSAATGFAPSTSIEDGMARFVAWYRQFYGPKRTPANGDLRELETA